LIKIKSTKEGKNPDKILLDIEAKDTERKKLQFKRKEKGRKKERGKKERNPISSRTIINSCSFNCSLSIKKVFFFQNYLKKVKKKY